MGIYLIAGFIKGSRIRTMPEYQFYRKALFIKIFGALIFGAIYIFYYGGGDTTNYFESSMAYCNVALKDFGSFIQLVFGENTNDMVANYFDASTGYPIYRLTDQAAIFTTTLYVPLVFLGGYSFFVTSVLAAVVSFTGLWRLYLVFVKTFPQLKREMFISIFCIPSVFFWGSGIMKDSIIIGAIGWYVYAFYNVFVGRKNIFRNLVFLVISSYIMIMVKPYVFFALLPGSILWLSNMFSKRFGNSYMRTLFTPIIMVLSGIVAYVVLNQFDDLLGLYKLETVIDRAYIVNKDMQMDYYGGKSFSIGDYEPTLQGMMSVAHKAVFAALFRPSILDVRNVVMFLSAIENIYILLLTIVLLIRLKVIGFFSYMNVHPLVLFSVLFSLFFAFSVGVSISNFGSLVRLRIPALPFFVSALFVIRYYYQVRHKKRIRI